MARGKSHCLMCFCQDVFDPAEMGCICCSKGRLVLYRLQSYKGESLLAYEADTEPGLSLESAVDVSLDMDLEDINSCTRDSDARNSDSDMENSDSAVDSEEE
ncbi:hypothetical protein L208DRAFT_1382702 [Tricholoma matsutake]|nr:hypothetical protein L208DRAFT_1382702 [Tricholoma matsutake 945]